MWLLGFAWDSIPSLVPHLPLVGINTLWSQSWLSTYPSVLYVYALHAASHQYALHSFAACTVCSYAKRLCREGCIQGSLVHFVFLQTTGSPWPWLQPSCMCLGCICLDNVVGLFLGMRLGKRLLWSWGSWSFTPSHIQLRPMQETCTGFIVFLVPTCIVPWKARWGLVGSCSVMYQWWPAASRISRGEEYYAQSSSRLTALWQFSLFHVAWSWQDFLHTAWHCHCHHQWACIGKSWMTRDEDICSHIIQDNKPDKCHLHLHIQKKHGVVMQTWLWAITWKPGSWHPWASYGQRASEP